MLLLVVVTARKTLNQSVDVHLDNEKYLIVIYLFARAKGVLEFKIVLRFPNVCV